MAGDCHGAHEWNHSSARTFISDDNEVYASWRPISPGEVADLFRAWSRFWCVTGGWALDLCIGRQTRDHDDTDVLILRRDTDALHSLLPDWELWGADPPGELRRWQPSEPLPELVHDIWCREVGSREWRFQMMVMGHDEDRWIFRRNRAIGGALNTLTIESGDMPIIAPEIQLLFEGSSTIRPKDVADVEVVLPHSNGARRAWLRDALAIHDPVHPWLPPLAEA